MNNYIISVNSSNSSDTLSEEKFTNGQDHSISLDHPTKLSRFGLYKNITKTKDHDLAKFRPKNQIFLDNINFHHVSPNEALNKYNLISMINLKEETIKEENKTKEIVHENSPHKKSKNHHMIRSQVQVQEEPEKICRICLETQENVKSGKFITPCFCSGSIRYIHEECLKKWIISKNMDKRKAACELCKRSFSSLLKSRTKFACDRGYKSIMNLVWPTGLIFCLITIIVYLSAFIWYKTINLSILIN